MRSTRRYNRHRLLYYRAMRENQNPDVAFIRACRVRERQIALYRSLHASTPPTEAPDTIVEETPEERWRRKSVEVAKRMRHGRDGGYDPQASSD